MCQIGYSGCGIIEDTNYDAGRTGRREEKRTDKEIDRKTGPHPERDKPLF
jgi:hypothetical protein